MISFGLKIRTKKRSIEFRIELVNSRDSRGGGPKFDMLNSSSRSFISGITFVVLVHVPERSFEVLKSDLCTG